MSRYFSFLALASLLAACNTTPRSQQVTETATVCSCELSPLESIRRDSLCWARAGITADFVPPESRSLTRTLADFTQLQHEIDTLAAEGGGTLLIPQGSYALKEVIRIPSNVAVVGASAANTIIHIKLKEVFENSRHWMRPLGQAAAFLFDGSRNAALERLTLRYAAADFEPLDFEEYHHDWVRGVYHAEEQRDTALWVTTVWFNGAENCRLSQCRILQAGNHPVRIRDSRHITSSQNFIDRAYNKSGGGAGYYNLIGSEYCLLYQDTVKRIRHLSIHKGSRYNVVYGCELQVDVNFHNADRGHNLVENNRVRIPSWHSWHCFGTGAASKHEPPGPGNVLYRNATDYKGRGPEADSTVLYFMTDHYPKKELGEKNLVPTKLASEFPYGIYQPVNRLLP